MAGISDGRVLTDELRHALELLAGGRHVFLTGKAGTGKSTLIRRFMAETERNVVVVAPTGIAALNVDGYTIHRLFGFRTTTTPDDVRAGEYRPGRFTKTLASLQTLIIDEASMVRADVFDMVASALSRFGPEPGTPFGGVQIVLVGDLYQLPPVVTENEAVFFSTAYETPYFFSAHSFNRDDFPTVALTTVFRQLGDDRMTAILNEIREGVLLGHAQEQLNARADAEFAPPDDEFWLTLAPTNRLVTARNRQQLERLPGDELVHHARALGDLTLFDPPVEETLRFKVGAQVMMLNNDQSDRWAEAGTATPVLPTNDRLTRRYSAQRHNRRNVRLMHVDAMTVPQPLATIGEVATLVQEAGFSGLLFTETGRTAYLNAAVASQAVPGLELSTGVAVAFPRSPFVTAATAWELQEATGGKFRLGLGTQVRTHVVRRYGMDFERPGPRLRDYVRAVKACFNAFRTGQLEHHGDFYDMDFITPQWSAGPIDAPDPKVDIAAVNPWMLRMAGEVADGVHVHPLGEPGYIARHVVPNIAEGAEKSGRSPNDIAVIVPVMTIVGDTDEERDKERESVRFSMSFYGSTPNYAFIWDQAGFDGTTARIREKQKAGDFTGMAAQITDDHIATFATESTWDGLADALIGKYGKTATRLVLYNALADRERVERYGAVAQRISRA